MTSHDWDGRTLVVEDNHGFPVDLTTFHCKRCDSFISIRGIRAPFNGPTDWELEDNNVSQDCDLEAAVSVMTT